MYPKIYLHLKTNVFEYSKNLQYVFLWIQLTEYTHHFWAWESKHIKVYVRSIKPNGSRMIEIRTTQVLRIGLAMAICIQIVMDMPQKCSLTWKTLGFYVGKWWYYLAVFPSFFKVPNTLDPKRLRRIMLRASPL